MDIIIRTVKLEDIESINALYKEVDELHLKNIQNFLRKQKRKEDLLSI